MAAPGDRSELEALRKRVAALEAELARRDGAQTMSLAFRTYLDALQVGVVVTEERAFRLVNRAMEALTGYSTEQLLEPGFFASRLHPDDRKMVERFGNERARGLDAPGRYEVRMRHADGSWRRHELHPRRVEVGGQPVTLHAVVDVTERSQQQSELEWSEHRFRSVVDTAPVGILIWDGVSVSLANEMFAEMTGYSAEEIAGPGFIPSIVHPEDAKVVSERARLRLEGASGLPSRYPVRFIRKDGEVRWTEVSATTIPWEGGQRNLVALRDITDQRRADDALREDESLLRALVNTIPTGIVLANGERILFVNEAMERLTGRPREELEVVRGLRPLWHPDDQPAIAAAFWARLAGEPEPQKLEVRMIHADGSTRYVEVTGTRIERGDEPQLLVAIRDVSQWKEAEQALRESEARFASIFRASPLAMTLGRVSDWVLVDVNQAFADLVGLRRETLVDRPAMELVEYIGFDQRHLYLQAAMEAIQDGSSGPHEGPWRTADGRDLWVLYQFESMDIAGERYTLSTFIDVTDSHRATQQLMDSEERWRKAFLGSPVASTLVKPETFEMLDLNPAAEALFGTSAAEMIGKTPHELGLKFDETMVERYRETWTAMRSEPVVVETPRGTVHLLVSADAITLSDVLCVLVMMTDVTALRVAEAERRALEERIQQTQKLESLGILAGGIAHDFNNLLVGVMGNAGLALMELPPESPARRTVQDIEVAAQRAAELTRQMLAYSGKGSFVVESLDLSRIVEEMAHLLKVSIPPRCRLQSRFAADLPPIQGDATQVRQVVMNLITNAADALGEYDGLITVTTGSLYAGQDYLRDSYLNEELPAGEYVYLEIADTGTGMDEETRRRIFDPFFTTKFTGRGLGLAAVLGIVRGHRGAIKVRSEVGQGSVFRVLFPRAGEAHTRAVDRQGDSRSSWQGSGTVLVVDDDETVRAVTKLMLERSGFAVLAASDGAEGIALYREHGREIRAVILDMTMPRMDGEATFRAIQGIDTAARVILSSGYAEQEATGAFGSGALAGFIQKPYTAEDLLRTVRQVLGEGR